jgi:N-acetylglucosamine repressor
LDLHSIKFHFITFSLFGMKKATRSHTKKHNRILVLKTIFDHKSISRAEIARATNLTRTTVTDIITVLLDEGLVEEIGMGESHGGKTPILLSLAEDSRYLIGLDLTHSEFRASVINLRGKICDTVNKPVKDKRDNDALTLVYQTLDQLMETAYRPLVGIGVGTPGLVDSDKGEVINAVNLGWENLYLAELLQDRYGLPVFILNDSQAAAMGEYVYGAGHLSENNLIVINVRHGLGAGIVIKGQIFQGDGGGAGEIGHIVVQEGGLPCRCGNYGCLETIASKQALVKKVKQLAWQSPGSGFNLSTQEVDLDIICQAFSANDPQIQEIVLETARYLGIAISTMVATLNIEKIVLVGDMTCFGDPWLQVIRETMLTNTLIRMAKDTQVEIGQLGNDSVILGASAMLMNDYSLLFMHQFLQN